MSDQRNEPSPDEQDIAESLDDDLLADDSDDPAGELRFPPERPVGVNQYGTTPAEEQTGEPVDERARRDRPDRPVAAEEEWRIGRLVEPGADDDGMDLIDIEAEAVASRADIDEPDLSAEEAAMHLTQDPPLGKLGDGYLEEETI